MGQLRGDVAAAEDGEAAGEFGQTHDGVRRVIAGVLQAGDVGDRGHGPGGDDHVVGGDAVAGPVVAVDHQLAGAGEATRAVIDGDVVETVAVFLAAGCDRIDATEHPVDDVAPAHAVDRQIDAEFGGVTGHLHHVGGVHEHLRRDAAPVEAGTPEDAPLDDGDACVVEVGRDDAVARTGSEDDQVVVREIRCHPATIPTKGSAMAQLLFEEMPAQRRVRAILDLAMALGDGLVEDVVGDDPEPLVDDGVVHLVGDRRRVHGVGVDGHRHRPQLAVAVVDLERRSPELFGAIALGVQDVGVDQARAQHRHVHAAAGELVVKGLADARHGVLGRVVGAHPRVREQPGHRGRDHDVAPVGCVHRRQERRDAVDDAVEVHVESPSPVDEVEFVHRSAGGDAGVEADDVDIGEAIDGSGAQGVHRSRIRDVAPDPESRTPGRLELGHGVGDGRFLDVPHDHPRPRRDEPPGHGATDPAGPAGDHYRLGVELHRSPSSGCGARC